MPELPLSRREIAKILKQAQSGNITPISELKNRTPNFHWSLLKYDNTGDTILHCAARLGHLDTVKYLLSFDPSGVDCKNNDDKTPLHEASQFCQPEICKLLLENGAKINALKRADWTPLMLACTKKCLETVRILAENGALINYSNKDGWSCMHLAAREGCKEIFSYLNDKGGDCGAKTKNGRSVLHVASLHGSVGIVKILLDRNLVDIGVKDNCGNTPLHEAVLGRNVSVCRMLVEKGADLYCTNGVDFNLLHLASSEGYDDLIEYIVNALNFDINVVSANGFSALHCAARKGQKDTCKFLISLGCNKDLKDDFGRVAFDYFTAEII